MALRSIPTPVSLASTEYVGREIAEALKDYPAVLREVPESLRKQALKDLSGQLKLVVEEWCEKWKHADDSELEPEEELSDEAEDSDGESPQKAKRPRRAVTSRPRPPQDGYPGHFWPSSAKPGHAGFSAQAREFLDAATDWKPSVLGSVEWLPQQRNVVLLLHPESPIKRLLVDHHTGSGKTLLMLLTLGNYYFDTRPKVVIFPKDTVCDNFYRSLLEWPSRWRDFFASQYPVEAGMAADHHDWRKRRHEKWSLDRAENSKLSARFDGTTTYEKFLKTELVVNVRAALEMKRAFRNGQLQEAYVQKITPSLQEADAYLPGAPLRAYRFTSAGGRAADIEDGVPISGIFKVGFDTKDGNVYSNKIVVMDEGHHLTRPHPLYSTQLRNLRSLMHSARNTVFAVCTGTMAEDSVRDPRSLLDAVKGRDNANLNDEGFLSSYHVRGHGFPKERPQGVADGALTEVVERQLVSHVELTGNALVRYMFNEMKFRKEGHRGKQLDAILANYTNLYCLASSFGNATSKANVMNQTRDWAPKLEQIVDLVAESARKQRKVVVMISRKNGFAALLELVKQRGHIDGFGVCDDSASADFNESRNRSGDRYRVRNVKSK